MNTYIFIHIDVILHGHRETNIQRDAVPYKQSSYKVFLLPRIQFLRLASNLEVGDARQNLYWEFWSWMRGFVCFCLVASFIVLVGCKVPYGFVYCHFYCVRGRRKILILILSQKIGCDNFFCISILRPSISRMLFNNDSFLLRREWKKNEQQK